MKKAFLIITVLATAALVTACGGREGGNSSQIPSEPLQPSAVSESNEQSSLTSSTGGNSSQVSSESLQSSATGESGAPLQPSSAGGNSSLISSEPRPSSAASESVTAQSQTDSAGGIAPEAENDGKMISSEGGDGAVKNARIKLTFNNQEIVAELDDNPTSRDFLTLLPMTAKFEDYSGTEKITYPSSKLSAEGAPAGYDPSAGDLTLYAPWGNLAIFYKDFGYASGLVRMGHIESGIEKLAEMDGDFNMTIERVE